MSRCAAVLLVGALVVPASVADSPENGGSRWPQWRGPERNGVSEEVGLPLSWSTTENVVWKLAIEGKGHSSPVIWDDHLFVTTDIQGEVIPGAKEPVHIRAGETYRHPAGEGADKRHTLKVLSIHSRTGDVRWSRTVHDGGVFDNRHRVNTYASPTTVTDGEMAYFYFGSQGLFAFDFDGNLVWETEFGDVATWGHGHGTSPLLHEQLLILQIDQNEGDGSFLVALDKTSGKEVWRTPREERINYSSPILVESQVSQLVITTSYHNVIAYDPTSGAERWRSPGFLGNAVPTAVANGDIVFAVSGYPDKLTRAIQIPGNGAESADAIWEYKKGSGYTPSPLLYRGYLYLVSDKGILTCLQPKTGAVVYEGARIPLPTFVRASPVAWDDKILLSGEDGDFFVIRAGKEHEILGQASIGERTIASPAIAGGLLYIRSEQHLYAIGDPMEAGQ